MAESISLVRIFIASPTGLEAERRLVRDIAEEINETHVEHWRCEIKIVGWEDTIVGYKRPQDKINQDLDKCDYFFGFLYNRWGTPPSLPGEGYSSGFEEEYNRAVSKKQSGDIKDIALFFRMVDSPVGFEPGADLKKVREFRQICIDEKKVYFFDYSDLDQFRSAVRKKIFEIGWAESGSILEKERVNLEPERVEGTESSQLVHLFSQDVLLEARPAQFLTNMISRSADWDGQIASDIARMRLIAVSVSRPGNDESYLGVHDANLVFKTFRNEGLSDQEYRALVVCGVAGFASHNVPIWHWVAAQNGRDKPFSYIAELAVWGPDLLKLNALRILECAKQEIPTLEEDVPKDLLFRMWFSDGANDQIFAAANRFLSHCASLTDIPHIESALEVASPARKAQVELSIVTILAKSNATAALRRILEKDLDGVADLDIERVFARPSTLSTEIVRLCLVARADRVRVKAVQILRDRLELKTEEAKSLLSDRNVDIRCSAVEFLELEGVELSDEDVRKALIYSKPMGTLLLSPSKNTIIEDHYEEYRERRLKELRYGQIVIAVDSRELLDDVPLIALIGGAGKANLDYLRRSVDSNFSDYFDEDLARLKKIELTEAESYVSRLERIRGIRLSKIMGRALTALCIARDKQDLERVRRVLDESLCLASDAVLEYLERYGDWSDIKRILGLQRKTSHGLSLLSIDNDISDERKAKAIAVLSRGRVVDILKYDMEDYLKGIIIKYIHSREISELDDENMIEFLLNKADEVREKFVIRCVLSLGKRRLEGLLRGYIGRDEAYYYNVVHWLDLGVSLPKPYARAIAQHNLDGF